MTSKKLNRVVFFSKEDLSSVHNLRKAEELLNSIDLNSKFDINDLLEFYNVKLYFDNNIFLLTWTDSVKNNFIDIINKTWELTRKFWVQIKNDNIIAFIGNLELDFRKSFWELINYFQVYKKIDKEIFALILNKFSHHIHYILTFKDIVNHFDNEMKAFLLEYDESAELILSKTERTLSASPNYFFPSILNHQDKENIISKYLDTDNVNLNYVRLIENSKDVDLKLSPKVRLKAKKKGEELNDRIFEEGYSWKEGVQITLDKDQDEPVKFSKKEHLLEVSYGEKFLNDQPNDIALFHLFRSLFIFTDLTGLITLVNKENELGVMEKIFTVSKNEYLTGTVFRKKTFLSHLQILVFAHYLKERNNSIERLINSFINDFLNAHFEINNLRFKFPTKNSTYLEKIRILAPEFEFLLKQFQNYVIDGNIDFELLEINSIPLRFSGIPSLVNKKYIYTDSDIIRALKYHFFSDQSGLYYIERYKDKNLNLYDRLRNESIEFDDFHDYQKHIISKLIQDNHLFIDSNGHIRIKLEIRMFLISELNKNEVISYWHYREAIRNEIDEMVDENLLYYENTLFTKPELNYFNFYLNKKEFTNGLDIRNKYLHGTNTGSEKEHENEYYILIKLIILALLKIEDDLIIKKKLSAI